MLGMCMGQAQAGPGYASVRPEPRVEYWQRRQIEIDAALGQTQALAACRLVFVGDSITDFWLLDESPWVRGQTLGRKVWNESFAGTTSENRALNLGISGDRTEHVLYRLLPRAAGGLGHLDSEALRPEFIVLMLGINNTWAPEDPVVDSVYEGVRAVLDALHERKPEARIVLQSILPTNDALKNSEVVQAVNRRLAAWAAQPAHAAFAAYLDLYPAFVDASGLQVARYFNDGLHPNDAGYRVWRDRLLPFLKSLRDRPPARPVGSAQGSSLGATVAQPGL
jgi:lysophospholipase L1-like esterase